MCNASKEPHMYYTCNTHEIVLYCKVIHIECLTEIVQYLWPSQSLVLTDLLRRLLNQLCSMMIYRGKVLEHYSISSLLLSKKGLFIS